MLYEASKVKKLIKSKTQRIYRSTQNEDKTRKSIKLSGK